MWPLLLIAGLASSAPRAQTTAIPRTAAELAAAAEAERLGRDIYDFDQAAWGATDALTAAVPNLPSAGVAGWIVEREPSGTVAIFYGLEGGRPYKFFVAHMRGQKVQSSHILAADEDRSMTSIERRMADARTLALKQETLQKIDFRPCTTSSINTVVLPPATDGAVPVYILTPQATLDQFPLGGHYRVDIGATPKR